MRLLTDANGFQILFYRSLSLCAIVGLVIVCAAALDRPSFYSAWIKQISKWARRCTGFYLLCLRHALYQRCLNSVYPLGHALYDGDNRLGLD